MNKRKLYKPYTKDIEKMIENGFNIQNIYAAISEESRIDASIETFKNFLKDNDMLPESKKQETSVKDIFGNIANYTEFHEGWVRTSCRLNRAMSNPNRILMRRYLQKAMKKRKRIRRKMEYTSVLPVDGKLSEILSM